MRGSVFSNHTVWWKALGWIFIGLAVLAAMQFYYVQEMLAALILFTALFGSIVTALFLLFVLDRAGEAVLHLFELHVKNLLQHARRVWASSEGRLQR